MSIRIGIGNTIMRCGSAPAMSAGETAIRAGNTVAWYDSQDLTTITKDGSNFVSFWNDKLLSGNMIGTSGVFSPIYSADGILFDGIDDFMKSNGWTLNQPCFIYAVMRQVTWIINSCFFDGIAQYRSTVYNAVATPQVRFYAGAASTSSSDLAVNTFGIIRVLFDEANSKMIINNNTPVTGNVGAGNPSGFTLGASGAGVTYNSNSQFKEVIIRNITDTANEANIYAYLKAKYSL